MGAIIRIKEGMKTYTSTEKKIANYILKNKVKIVDMSAIEIANKIDASSSAVVRFAKKIGYKGLPQLKVDLAADNNDVTLDFYEAIESNDSIETIANKCYLASMLTLEKTYNLLNMGDMSKSRALVNQAQKIYLLGVGASQLVCADLMQKLVRINYSVVNHSDFHVQLSALANATSNDVVIAISYRGQTREINSAVKMAKKKHVPVIAITQIAKSPLAKLADIALYVPNEENDIRLGAISSRISSLALTDLLYIALASDDVEQTRTEINRSRLFVKQINED